MDRGLFVAQSRHGIEAPGVACRDIAGGEPYQGQHGRNRDEGQRILWADAEQLAGHEPCQCGGSGGAGDHAGERHPLITAAGSPAVRTTATPPDAP